MLKNMTIFVVSIILFAFAGMVNADPRIESRDGIAHFIFDPVNTDDEMKSSGVAVHIYEDDVGHAWGYVNSEILYDCAALPVGVSRLEFTQDDSDALCALVDDGGTVYASDVWRSVVRIGANNGHGECLVKMGLRCAYGVLTTIPSRPCAVELTENE